MTPSNESKATLGKAITEARERTGLEESSGRLSIRQLAKRAGVSPGQLARIESGQALRPGHEILVAVGRALNRNPLPLLILAGHLEGAEARDELKALFYEGAGLPDRWGDWACFDIETIRGLLVDPDCSEDDIRSIAADAFRAETSDETRWDDSYELTMVRGEEAAELRELMGIWIYVRDHRSELLQYGRTLRRLTDLEYLADVAIESLEQERSGGTAKGS